MASIQEAPLKRSLHMLFASLALLLVPCAQAQDAAEEIPECNPARPTVSTPATLTPVGYLQFENGTIYAADSAEFGRRFGVNQVTKLAVHSRLQLMALSEPLTRSTGTGGSDGYDPGGFLAGFQVVLVPGEGARPTISASYIRQFYGGTATDFDIGSADNSLILLVSTDLGGFHFDINGMANEQVDGTVRRAQFGQTLSVSHPVGKVTIGGELWHFSQPLSQGNAVGNLWAVSYGLRKNLVIDAGFDHGFTGTSTQWEGFAGFTYLLPHRLWRARKTQSQPQPSKANFRERSSTD
jgi:hypothetical protein